MTGLPLAVKVTLATFPVMPVGAVAVIHGLPLMVSMLMQAGRAGVVTALKFSVYGTFVDVQGVVKLKGPSQSLNSPLQALRT